MSQLKAFILMFVISLSMSMSAPNRESFYSKAIPENGLIRLNRQNTGTDLDYIEESPVDDDHKSGEADVPLPEGIPPETEEGLKDESLTKDEDRLTNSEIDETIPKNKFKNEFESDVKSRIGDDSKKEELPENESELNLDQMKEEVPDIYNRKSDINARNRLKGSDKSVNSRTIGNTDIDNTTSDNFDPISITTTKRPKPVEICDKPVIISSANRFVNNTVRLFRDNSYWDLMGLPDRKAFTSERKGLFGNMAPVTRFPNTSIVTIMEGHQKLKGSTFKFQKTFFWRWDEQDIQVSGGNGGENLKDFPDGGFDTMFHNANDTKPMIIAFKDNLVYYLSTKEEDLEFLDPDGKEGGKFKENYPPGVTSAFTYPLGDSLLLYLFRDDKYCMREVGALQTGNDCDEWRETAELFGCILTEAPTSPNPTMINIDTESPTNPVTTTKTTTTTKATPPRVEPVFSEMTTSPKTNPNNFGSHLKCSTFVTFVAFSTVVLKYNQMF